MRIILAIALAYSVLIGMYLALFKIGKVADERTDRLIKEEIERWSA